MTNDNTRAAKSQQTWAARSRLLLLIVAGFSTLVATSDVTPGYIDGSGFTQTAVRITVKRARAAGSSSLVLDGRDTSDALDGGAASTQIRVWDRTSQQVIGYDGATDWHLLCESLDDCTLELELRWPDGETPEVVEVQATLADTLRASGPICTAGDSFDQNASVTVESID